MTGGSDDVVRVMVVDDQQLVRAGFSMVLNSRPDITVVAEAADGQDALDTLDRVELDVVLMDIRMPRLDGIAATHRIAATRPDTRVIVLTTFDLDTSVARAIAAGASGFLLKDVAPEKLIEAIHTVHRGEAMVDAASTRRLLRQAAPLLAATPATQERGNGPTGEIAAILAQLTPREREVLTLMGNGATNTEIAEQQFVSEATVKTHVGHILAKTGSRDRVQAVVFAFRAGLAS